MPPTLHFLLLLSIYWLEWVGFECDHEQWGLPFRFPLLLAQLSIRSTDTLIHSVFNSQSFFSFYSTLLSYCSKSLSLHYSSDPSLYFTFYSDHVRFNLFVLIWRHDIVIYSPFITPATFPWSFSPEEASWCVNDVECDNVLKSKLILPF